MQYTKETSIQFSTDMSDAGFEVKHYNGRFYWEGPAVSAADHHELADIIASTSVKLQWDNLGLGYIVYPIVSDPGVQTLTTGE